MERFWHHRVNRTAAFLLIAATVPLFSACDRGTLHTNKRALQLAKFEREGKIRQAADKNEFFRLVGDQIADNMADAGYGHRIRDMRSTWNVYEDKDYDIVTGSVAKTDSDIFMFLLVHDRKGGPVFQAIGERSDGQYPAGIIPDSIQ